MSDEITVYVAVSERNLLAGRLYPHRRRGIESASFAYDDRYLADPEAYDYERMTAARTMCVAARR